MAKRNDRRVREFPVQVPPEVKDWMGECGSHASDIWIMRSGFERDQAARLIANGVIFNYEAESFEYLAKVHRGGCRDCGSPNVGSRRSYTPDFYFPFSDIYVETKGRFTSADRTKMKAVIEQCDIDLRMVFMSDGKATPKMRYSEWCALNNIKYAIGAIPLNWAASRKARSRK
jgi:hypothetical protein